MPAAVTIAQEQEQARLAYALQRRANIDLVGLTSIAAKCTKPAHEVTFPLKFLIQHHVEPALVDGQKLTAPVQFNFKVLDDKDIEVIAFHCVIRADYDLNEGYQPTKEEIDAFTESNAVFNCWPYFREIVQSTLTRLNYPPLSIPFLRLIPKSKPTVQPIQTELIDETAQKKMIEGVPPPAGNRHRRTKGEAR